MNIKKYIQNLIKYIKNGGVVYVNVNTINASDRFKNKRVLVTGGTSGIGLEVAKEFLAEGAEVMITGRHLEVLDKIKTELSILYYDKIHTSIWDVANVSDAKLKLDEVSKVMNGIDIIINNAGIYESSAWNQVTEDSYDRVNNINAKGLFFMCQAEGEYFINNHIKGRIVNINSIAGLKSGFDPYSVSKWSSVCITKSIAKVLVKHGIVVNGIAPGNVVTNIHDGVRGKNVKDNAYMPSHLTERYTLVEEIASMALYLSSDMATNIIGQVIAIDGGWTLN